MTAPISTDLKTANLTEGMIAPPFTLSTTEGEITNDTFIGDAVVLFFYPKDNTPGCTVEAIDFTALLPEFDALGVKVVGISKDSLKKHANFTEKHSLKVTLASDQDGTVCEDFGVWREKKMYGKTFWGIERATFLLGKDGRIARVWRKVKAKGHAAEVLDAIKQAKL